MSSAATRFDFMGWILAERPSPQPLVKILIPGPALPLAHSGRGEESYAERQESPVSCLRRAGYLGGGLGDEGRSYTTSKALRSGKAGNGACGSDWYQNAVLAMSSWRGR